MTRHYNLYKKTIGFLLFLDLDQQPVKDTLTYSKNIALNRKTAAVSFRRIQNPSSGYQIDFDVAYQFGTMARQAGVANISAYMFAADLVWHFTIPFYYWAGPAIHFVSGDDDTDPCEIGYFYDNYSSKHKTFGHMDYFKSATGTKSSGLRDFILRGGFSPTDKLTCRLDLHHFNVEKTFVSLVDQSPLHTIGQELDFLMKYIIRKGLTVDVGFDLFLSTEEWKGPAADTSTFIYTMITATL